VNAIERLVGLGLAVVALGGLAWVWLSAGPMREPQGFTRDRPPKQKHGFDHRTGQ
jgi:hypothetical protein